ncbi:MAG TPA: cytochrome P450, partial [Candidatus Binataceae bacterium]
VIAQMLGVPPEDWETLRGWVHGIVLSRGIVRTPEMMAEGDASARNFDEYLRRLIAEKKFSLGGDLMSALLSVEEKGKKLSDDQIVTMIETLFAAGHATTRNLIGNGVLALLRNPAELKKLRENPGMIASAVEEMLRYDSPTQAPSPQIATEDVVLGGHRINKGETVSVLFGAANRDPARFPEPDRFEIARKDNEHLAFSHGIHYCLGASLARMEAQIAIAALVRRMPSMRLASENLEWRKAGRFRGLVALPVEV